MEISEPQAEKNLLADIERLRGQFPQTQELYREVCTLMFFRYGITPTANRLYQLVRKGSMSAPAEALNRFWEQLREKSRVAIEHPDLPDELKKAAGELTAALWTSAQNAAAQTLDVFLAEAKSQIELARMAEAKAANKRDNLADALLKEQEAHSAGAQQQAQLRQELAAAAATNAALESRLVEARDDSAAQRARFDEQRREHLAELDKLRAQVVLADERSSAMQKHALLEIDRERTNLAKLQKVLDAERAASAAVIERQRVEYNIQQAALADLRQQNGSLDGALKTLTQARDQLEDRYVQAHEKLTEELGKSLLAYTRAEQLQSDLNHANAEAQRLAAIAAKIEASRAAEGKRSRKPADDKSGGPA